MATHLPTLACLRAAEAVARHRSFSRAAVELNLTQTAVSHQIHKLETQLGARLFTRHAGMVRLTSQGEDYLADIRPLIVGIVHATDRLSGARDDRSLTIGCPGTFLLKCLAPRLSRFADRYPQFDIRIRTLDPYGGGEVFKDLDIVIRYGLGTFPGHSANKIADERIFPVCSPSLLGGRSLPIDPAELFKYRVIRTTTPLLLRDDWPLWLETIGLSNDGFVDEMSCDLLYACFELAIRGMGVVMGRTPIVSSDIAAGNLIAPCVHSLDSASGYYLTVPEGRERRESVQVFRHWLLAAFAG